MTERIMNINWRVTVVGHTIKVIFLNFLNIFER
jgi:hypothetical protein